MHNEFKPKCTTCICEIAFEYGFLKIYLKCIHLWIKTNNVIPENTCYTAFKIMYLLVNFFLGYFAKKTPDQHAWQLLSACAVVYIWSGHLFNSVVLKFPGYSLLPCRSFC